MDEVEERIKAAKDEAEAELKQSQEQKEPEKKEEAPAEPEKKEEPEAKEAAEDDAEEKPKKSGRDYAKERIDRAAREQAMAEELRQANARLQALEAALKPKEKADEAPDRDEDPVGYTEWHLRKTQEKLAEVERRTTEQEKAYRQREVKERALNEVRQYEAQAMQKLPDFEQAKTFYAQAVAYSVRALAPTIDHAALVEIVNERMLNRAAEFARAGSTNPAMDMYEEAKAMGYVRKEGEEKPAPDMDKVAKNRARNAGTAGAASGSDGGRVTAAAIANMSNAEYMRLPYADRRRIELERFA